MFDLPKLDEEIVLTAQQRLKIIKAFDPKSMDFGDFTSLKEVDFQRIAREAKQRKLEKAALKIVAKANAASRPRKRAQFDCPAYE